MKKIIRKNVFETNSSSTHSISLSKVDQEFTLDTIYPDQNGVIKITGEEFGWGWGKYNDSLTKLAYVFQDSNEDAHDTIKEVVMEQTGATMVLFDEGDGYIDHEGHGESSEARGSKDSLRNFIFNKNSWLFIGNDNSTPDPTFYHVPEFKDGAQILPEYKYELVIDKSPKTTKFLNYPTDEELEDGISSIIDGVLVPEDGEFITNKDILWQISRPRGIFYESDYQLNQDYSKNEILFRKENDSRMFEIGREMDADPEIKKLRWDEKRKIRTERAVKMSGLVKKIKFELKKI